MHTKSGRAACYLRSSKDRKDVSIQDQRRQLNELAKARGLTIVREFSDSVESGKDENRPGFQSLIQELRTTARGWDCILALDTSRIARRRHIAIVFEEIECKRRGVSVLYRSIPDADPITEMLLKSILQAMDEWHSLTSRQKGLAGMAENVRRGFRAGGRAPIGYALERIDTGAVRDGKPVTKSKLVPSADSHKVRRYLQARAAGVQRGKAAELAGINLSKASMVGVEWNALTYAGHTVWGVNREREDGIGYGQDGRRKPRSEWTVQRDTHAALITEDEAETILRGLEAYNRKSTRDKGADYILSGMVLAPDGSPWHGDRGAYRCESKDGRRQVSRSKLEGAVLEHIKIAMSSPQFVREVTKAFRAMQSGPTKAEADAASEQLRKVEGAMGLPQFEIAYVRSICPASLATSNEAQHAVARSTPRGGKPA